MTTPTRTTNIDDIRRLAGRRPRRTVVHPIHQWRELPLEDREKLLEKRSELSAAAFRRWLQDKTGIRFRNDGQVDSAERITRQDRVYTERSERAESFERFWRQENPQAPDASVRKAVLGFLMMEAAATEEARTAINAARELRELDRLDLDRDKFEELKRQAQKGGEAERVAGDKDLSPEEKKERYAQIFGLG